ncbi:AMIN-like domain-containing (lipo)protein [Kribbella endophytica]
MTMFSSVRHPVRTTIGTGLAAFAVAALPAAAAPPDTTAARPSAECASGWGSLPEATKTLRPATVENVRTGRHACFDRLVIDLAGPATAYQVQYVNVVQQEGSGDPIPARGGAKLRIDVEAPAYDDAGRPTYPLKNLREVSNVSGYDTFRQVAWGGSFEGRTTLALGVRARLPFQSHLLTGPGNSHRLVVDVAHRW